MKSRFLTVTLAVAGMLFAQQAITAKSHTGSATKTSNKHHKKHTKKTAGMSTKAPAAQATLATS